MTDCCQQSLPGWLLVLVLLLALVLLQYDRPLEIAHRNGFYKYAHALVSQYVT